MRILIPFVMVVVMTTTMTVLATSQTLPAPQAITDPKLITSKPDARVEKSLSIEKLYMTRQVGGSTWSPDGWSPNGTTVAFVSNLSGRNNLWLVAVRRWMADATHGQRSAPDQPDLVAGRQVDRLHVRLRRRRAMGHFSGVAENWTGREPHQHARDRGGKSRLVARWPLSRLHGQTENVVRIRD